MEAQYTQPSALPYGAPQVMYVQVPPGQYAPQPIPGMIGPFPVQPSNVNPVPQQSLYPSLYPVAPVVYAQPSSPYPAGVEPSVPYSPTIQPALAPYTPGVAPGTTPTVALEDETSKKLDHYFFVGTYGKIRAYEIEQTQYSVNSPPIRTVWNEELKGTGYHMVHVNLNRGVLYAATNGNIFCIDAHSGRLIWSEKPPAQHGGWKSDLMTLLCSADGNLLFSACHGNVIALNARTGQYIWQQSMMKEQWTGKYGSFALLEFKGMLIVGNAGHVYALHMGTGQLVWKNSLEGYGYGPISLAAYTFTSHGSYSQDILYVGTYGYILALDAATGFTRHHVNMKGTGYKPVAMLINAASDRLYAATSGELRCYHAESMKEIWKSNLPGMGYSFGHSLMLSGNHILIGMQGKVMSLDKETGNVAWTASLPGCGYELVTLSALKSNPSLLLCASCGKFYTLNISNGALEWRDNLKGLGYNHLTISTTQCNTDFNSTTLPQYIEMARKNNQ